MVRLRQFGSRTEKEKEFVVSSKITADFEGLESATVAVLSNRCNLKKLKIG